VSLPGHSAVLHQAIKPSFREDHFSGSRPKLSLHKRRRCCARSRVRTHKTVGVISEL
jgi:hypothetical protein